MPALFPRLIPPLLIFGLCSQVLSQQFPVAAPATVGMSAERLSRMDAIIQAAIEKKELPGAVVLVARHGRVVWRKAYGARAVEPQREVMTTATIFEDRKSPRLNSS